MAILENTFQHESPMTGNSMTYYALGCLDYGRSILDVVALADPQTYQWVHAQHSNKLGEKYFNRTIKDFSEDPNDT